MSSLLSYHIFSFFISNIFENFKFGRNFSKFTAGMGCRLVAVSVKIGGNRRLPIGKENTGSQCQLGVAHGATVSNICKPPCLVLSSLVCSSDSLLFGTGCCVDEVFAPTILPLTDLWRQIGM